MSEPEQTAANLTPAPESCGLAESLTFEAVSKSILKLTEQAAIGRVTTAPFWASDRAVEAMQRLVAIVAEVRSPQGGWPEHLPPTPENLTPYVAEEASEVLDAWGSDRAGRSSRTKAKKYQYILVEDLIPELLWYLAKSSEEIMRLLAGVKAQCCLPQGEATSGTLRLAAILEADAGDLRWSVDLATLLPLQYRLPADATIQISPTAEAIAAEQYAQQLREQILAASPEVSMFLESASVELLKPGSSWKSGSVKLTVDFEFIADRPETSIAIIPVPPNSQARVRLADPALVEKYRQSLIRQKLIGAISAIAATADSAGTADALNTQQTAAASPTPASIACLVAAACSLADAVQVPFSGEPPAFQLPEMLWEELIHRLLWQLVSSSYEVMQLVGGVRASVLQQHQSWASGTLRCRAILKVVAGDLNWNWDLSSGEVLPENIQAIAPNAIVQSSASRLLQEAIPAHTLLKWLKRQVIQTTPEVQLFAEGTRIEWLTSEENWQPASVQLSLALEFLP